MMPVDEDGLDREGFERAVLAVYPTLAHLGARLTLRRDHPDSPRFGQYVAHQVEFAWQVWQRGKRGL